MTVRRALYGDRRTRARVVTLAVSVPVAASVAFLAGYDAVLGTPLLSVPLGIALYAGWSRAGMLAGCGAVSLTILWRFVFPPLIGYLRQSMDTRYTPPRLLAYKLDPVGELVEGLTYGPLYALVGGIVLGTTAYLVGRIGRRI